MLGVSTLKYEYTPDGKKKKEINIIYCKVSESYRRYADTVLILVRLFIFPVKYRNYFIYLHSKRHVKTMARMNIIVIKRVW